LIAGLITKVGLDCARDYVAEVMAGNKLLSGDYDKLNLKKLHGSV
jgi:hypothetical protein